MDVYHEVARNYSVFVLANIFGAQLHLAGLDVVAALNESCVEHDATHRFVGEARMLENDLHVTLQDHALLLLLGQQENHAVFFLTVLLLRSVRENLPDVQTSAAVHFEEGDAAAA